MSLAGREWMKSHGPKITGDTSCSMCMNQRLVLDQSWWRCSHCDVPHPMAGCVLCAVESDHPYLGANG